MSGATMFNLSLLTTDVWAVAIRIFFYHQQVTFFPPNSKYLDEQIGSSTCCADKSYAWHKGKLDILSSIRYRSNWISHLLYEVSWIQLFLNIFIFIALKLLKINTSYCLWSMKWEFFRWWYSCKYNRPNNSIRPTFRWGKWWCQFGLGKYRTSGRRLYLPAHQRRKVTSRQQIMLCHLDQLW
jgi:hypothetical protein